MILFTQDAILCSPIDYDCVTSVSVSDTYGCMVSCTGLYADVEFMEDTVLNTVADLGKKGYSYFNHCPFFFQ